jgi:hypothetical protein
MRCRSFVFRKIHGFSPGKCVWSAEKPGEREEKSYFSSRPDKIPRGTRAVNPKFYRILDFQVSNPMFFSLSPKNRRNSAILFTPKDGLFQ